MSNIHFGPLHEDCGPLPSDVGGLSGKRCKTLRLSNCQIVRLPNCELWEHVGTVNHNLLLPS